MQGVRGKEASKRKGPLEEGSRFSKGRRAVGMGPADNVTVFRRAERELRPDLAAPGGRVTIFRGARAVRGSEKPNFPCFATPGPGKGAGF